MNKTFVLTSDGTNKLFIYGVKKINLCLMGKSLHYYAKYNLFDMLKLLPLKQH